MTTTYTDAIDEIFGILNQAVLDNSEAIASYKPEIRWEGIANPLAVPNDKYWIRPTFQTVIDKQQTLSNADGVRRYECVGLLFVQLFCPKNFPDTKVKGRQLAEMIRSAFRVPPTSGNLWFRDQRIMELPDTATSFPINIVVTCTFQVME